MSEAASLEAITRMLESLNEKHDKANQLFLKKHEETSHRLNLIEGTVGDINTALSGSEKYGYKGAMSRIDAVEKYVEKDKMLKSKLAGMGFVVGVVWTFLLEYWKNFFNK